MDARSYWLSATDLDGEWHLIWNDYVKGLEYGRIRLRSQPDSLLWSYKNYSGSLTAAMAYESIVDHYLEPYPDPSFVHQILWKFNIPEKIRCFIWFLLNNKVLTWDQLNKHGVQGPSYCLLFKKDDETAQHLFMECLFTKSTFEAVFKHFGTRSL